MILIIKGAATVLIDELMLDMNTNQPLFFDVLNTFSGFIKPYLHGDNVSPILHNGKNYFLIPDSD